MKIPSLVHKGDFLDIQFDKNPARKMKIRVNLPSFVKEELIICLRDNANVISISSKDMTDIDPNFLIIS